MTGNRRQLGRAPGPTRPSSSLAELMDRLLDHGLVIDAWLSISLAGLELMTVQARVVVASVETYLTYAEAIAQTPPPAVRQDEGEQVSQGPAEDALTPSLHASPENLSDHERPVWYKIAPN